MTTYSTTKRQVCFEADSDLRSWTKTNEVIAKMYKSKNSGLLEILDHDGLKIEFFSMDYVRERLPLRFDDAGKLCQLKKITEDQKSNFEGFKIREESETILVYLPIYKFTTSQVYNLVKSAHNAEKRAANEAARAKKAQEKLERDAKRLAKLQAEVKKLTEKTETK